MLKSFEERISAVKELCLPFAEFKTVKPDIIIVMDRVELNEALTAALP